MIDNYIKHNNGVIQQIIKQKFLYDTEYVKSRYDTYFTVEYISYLRLGYIIGSIGHIPESILDIGYGNGGFLKVCSLIPNRGGVDITDYKLSKDIKQYKGIENLNGQHYQVVTFFDSLQHLENIQNVISLLNCKYIVISVPNCHYFNDQWFYNWKHRRENQHIWHFSKQALINFMEEMGYFHINSNNIQDCIRISNLPYDNILTSIFKKKL